MVKSVSGGFVYIATCSSLVAATLDGSPAILTGVNVECDLDTLRSCVIENSCEQSLTCGLMYEAYVNALISVSSNGRFIAEDLRPHFNHELSGLVASKITLGNDIPSTIAFKALSLKDETCANTKYRFETGANIPLDSCTVGGSTFCLCEISLDGLSLNQKELFVTFDLDVTPSKLTLSKFVSPATTTPFSFSGRQLAETPGASANSADTASGLPNLKRLSVDAGSQVDVSSSSRGSTWHGIRLFFLVVSFIGNAAFLVFVFWLSK
jgi:hypothetical protein